MHYSSGKKTISHLLHKLDKHTFILKLFCIRIACVCDFCCFFLLQKLNAFVKFFSSSSSSAKSRTTFEYAIALEKQSEKENKWNQEQSNDNKNNNMILRCSNNRKKRREKNAARQINVIVNAVRMSECLGLLLRSC